MHAEPQPDFSDLPSVDDTIAAMSILNRILDELRSKIAITEQTVLRLATEKSTLQKELWTIVEFASAQGMAQTRASATLPTASDATLDDLSALVKLIDSSFVRPDRSPRPTEVQQQKDQSVLRFRQVAIA